MEGTLHNLMKDLTCNECKSTLRKMVARVRLQWTLVPVRPPPQTLSDSVSASYSSDIRAPHAYNFPNYDKMWR